MIRVHKLAKCAIIEPEKHALQKLIRYQKNFEALQSVRLAFLAELCPDLIKFANRNRKHSQQTFEKDSMNAKKN